MLRLVSEAFNIVLESPDVHSRGIDNQNLLTILEWRISKIPVWGGCEDPTPGQMVTEDFRCLELFQLAILVYLQRASGKSPEQSENMRSRLARAFTIFSQIETMQRQFPMLILACEARTDDDRIIVLDLISRTEENQVLRSLGSMRGIIQSLWAQDDLAEREINYTDKIKVVLSSREILPSFI